MVSRLKYYILNVFQKIKSMKKFTVPHFNQFKLKDVEVY